MFASIRGQNNASLSGGRKGRHNNHTGTYFCPTSSPAMNRNKQKEQEKCNQCPADAYLTTNPLKGRHADT